MTTIIGGPPRRHFLRAAYCRAMKVVRRRLGKVLDLGQSNKQKKQSSSTRRKRDYLPIFRRLFDFVLPKTIRKRPCRDVSSDHTSLTVFPPEILFDILSFVNSKDTRSLRNVIAACHNTDHQVLSDIAQQVSHRERVRIREAWRQITFRFLRDFATRNTPEATNRLKGKLLEHEAIGPHIRDC